MHILRLMNTFDRSHFRISVALARSGGDYETNLEKDVLIHYLRKDQLHSSTLRMLRAIRPLRQLIQAEQPDIVCSAMDNVNVAMLLAVAPLRYKPKTVVSIQDTLKHAHYKKWQIAISRPLLALLTSKLYPHSDRVVVLSDGVQQEIIERIPQVEKLIRVIYNAGLDDRVLHLMQEPVSDFAFANKHDPLIIACGRLAEQKGFSYLIKAFSQVSEGTKANLLIIGEGVMRSQLEAQIVSLGLSDSIRLIGFQVNPYKYMAVGDVFVLSSLWEGFGNVIVEAMACGIPVVATNCPHGPGEIIQDGVNGLLVPPKDVNAMARAILRVLRDQSLKQKLSANGRERADRFHSRIIAREYEDLFDEII